MSPMTLNLLKRIRYSLLKTFCYITCAWSDGLVGPRHQTFLITPKTMLII